MTAFAREKHPDTIDKAYDYFWEGESPEEFLKGTALTLGFINFEDWLLMDYRVNGGEETFLDVYARTAELTDEETTILDTLAESRLSLYEVLSVAKDKRVRLRDLLLGGEHELREKALTRGLKKGDIFAARLLTLDNKEMLSGCVYPFLSSQKDFILSNLERQFKRYVRNVRPGGTMRDFLKDYGDIVNLVWIEAIRNAGRFEE